METSHLRPLWPCALAGHSLVHVGGDPGDDLAGRDVAGEVLRWHHACEIFEHLLGFHQSGGVRRPQWTAIADIPEKSVPVIRARIPRTKPVLALRPCHENPVA